MAISRFPCGTFPAVCFVLVLIWATRRGSWQVDGPQIRRLFNQHEEMAVESLCEAEPQVTQLQPRRCRECD